MARVSLKSSDQHAIRTGSASMQNILTAIWQSTPEQIETKIDGATVDQLKKLITILTLVTRDQEKRIRELERRSGVR